LGLAPAAQGWLRSLSENQIDQTTPERDPESEKEKEEKASYPAGIQFKTSIIGKKCTLVLHGIPPGKRSIYINARFWRNSNQTSLFLRITAVQDLKAQIPKADPIARSFSGKVRRVSRESKLQRRLIRKQCGSWLNGSYSRQEVRAQLAASGRANFRP
jgi:hypothetical protein